MALEQFRSTVKSLSEQNSYAELGEYLSKTGDALLSRNSGGLDSLLESLEPGVHSLGLISVHSAKLSCKSDRLSPEYIQSLGDFILSVSEEQVRVVPQGLGSLGRLYAEELLERGRALKGIPILVGAIGKMSGSKGTLTSLHAELCKLCLASKCLNQALPYLDVDYQDIAEECALDSRHVLLFYYYGGMIYAALKNFERSLYFLEVVVTLPSSVVSHVMFEAYKKYLLISLLVPDPSREQQKLPKYTSPVINKFMKILCAPYHDVFAAFFGHKAEDIQLSIHKHAETFNTDLNMGLISQILAAQTKMNIKRLTKTFLTLSLEDVASRVGLPSSLEAERKLVEMIEEGSIQAQISQKDGMVRFESNSEHFDSVGMLQKLEKNINSCIQLDKQILLMDDEIILNPSFARKSVLSCRELGESEDPSIQGGSKSVSSGSKLPSYSM
eukprot:TRINITY_DN4046_c0_g1_i1.p1 TRINITY_DN4046_c0_g1~~TRINITY_DN4046_c0_g1_i1.p1  ORF type:complete len:442 (-),score=127.35 TRINITY_DN4046_c0_g1_i1:49-1374(-)